MSHAICSVPDQSAYLTSSVCTVVGLPPDGVAVSTNQLPVSRAESVLESAAVPSTQVMELARAGPGPETDSGTSELGWPEQGSVLDESEPVSWTQKTGSLGDWAGMGGVLQTPAGADVDVPTGVPGASSWAPPSLLPGVSEPLQTYKGSEGMVAPTNKPKRLWAPL